jgi:hypothetical protein
MTHVGQCVILDMIQMLDEIGIHVINGNTDGVTFYAPNHLDDAIKERIELSQQLWDVEWEASHLSFIYQTSVNGYMCKTVEGKWKYLGEFGRSETRNVMDKLENSYGSFLVKGLIEWIDHQTSPEDFVRNANNLWDFVLSNSTTGKYVTSSGQEFKNLRYCVSHGGETVMQHNWNSKENRWRIKNVDGLASKEGSLSIKVLNDMTNITCVKDLKLNVDWYAKQIRKHVSQIAELSVKGNDNQFEVEKKNKLKSSLCLA